jgi:hypothetical protein
MTAERLKPTQVWQPRAIAVLIPPHGKEFPDAPNAAYPRSHAIFWERRPDGRVIERRRPGTVHQPDLVN